MLPTDAQARKDIPIYSGFIKYFPDAIAAVAALSKKGNDQHNPGKPLHWDRSKSGDEMDAQMRHVIDMAGGTEADTDGVLHATKNAWRAMAHLQKLLETKAVKAKIEKHMSSSVDAFIWRTRTYGSGLPKEAYVDAPTRTQSIPAAEREPMTPQEEKIQAPEYPAPEARATRWLMRRRNGQYYTTVGKYTPAALDALFYGSEMTPVTRIEH